MSLASWIERHAADGRIALHFEGRSVTYAELHRRVRSVATALTEAGIGAGDRVGWCGLNRVEFFECLFAAAHIGATLVPYNNRLAAVELGIQLADSAPQLVVVTDGFGSLLEATGTTVPVRNLDALPFPDRDGEPVTEHDDPEAIVLMVYTSGTTGRAKGARLSHRAMEHTVLNGVIHQQLTAADVIVAPLPTFHVGGVNIQTLPTLFAGGQVVLMRRFDPAAVLELIVSHRATQTLLVPAMLAAVAAQPGFGAEALSSLRGVMTGSSIIPEKVMRPFFEAGVPVGQVYGTTETGPTAVVLEYGDAIERVGSCGRPAEHSELRIVDPDGRDVGPGEPGELLVRGAHLFTDYWQAPGETAAAFAEGGWFRTGDVGHRDAQGWVTISDRIKDVVISGGENVYPAEVEPVLAAHPAVAEVAVIGEPDPQWGEVPVAVVVAEPDTALDLDELRSWCDGRLARFKQPRRLRIVDSLPRTALGKVRKHELRK